MDSAKLIPIETYRFQSKFIKEKKSQLIPSSWIFFFNFNRPSNIFIAFIFTFNAKNVDWINAEQLRINFRFY